MTILLYILAAWLFLSSWEESLSPAESIACFIGASIVLALGKFIQLFDERNKLLESQCGAKSSEDDAADKTST